MKEQIRQKLINWYEKKLAGRHYKDSNTKIIVGRIKELKGEARKKSREKKNLLIKRR